MPVRPELLFMRRNASMRKLPPAKKSMWRSNLLHELIGIYKSAPRRKAFRGVIRTEAAR